MMELSKHTIQTDPWQALRNFTAARIALGRTGVSIPVKENLQCKLAHAFARDAIYTPLAKDDLFAGIQNLQWRSILLHSKATGRSQYLQRPDLGRKLDDISVEKLVVERNENGYDICITIADGLSATAVNHHAILLLQALLPLLQAERFSIAPVCIIEQGRVAVSDETGSLLRAKISLILIGERPGLSSPDSLGAYLTYHPSTGNTDAMRNCISNIRPGGLAFELAAQKIFYLIKQSLLLQLSGVQLKEITNLLEE
jgi:ethanolamine ammonia-lyase small subunit